MAEQELYEHYRFEGARILLAPFASTGIPAGADTWKPALEPTVRALWDSDRRGGRTLFEIAAQLRAAADAVEARPESPPQGLAAPPALLREIADHVSGWNTGPVSSLAGAVPTSDELVHRFPQLIEMLGGYFGQDGLATEDELTEREGLQLFIDEWHPQCLWRLPHIAAECQEALAVFQTDAALHSFFELEHGLGSGTLPWAEWLPLIIDVFGEHMRARHPPEWVHKPR
jgi:hypothetical protein